MFSLSVKNERADAGRDGRTRLARPSSQRANEDRENIIFPVQLTTSRIGNHARLIHTLLKVITIHTLIHTTYILRGYAGRPLMASLLGRAKLCVKTCGIHVVPTISHPR